MKVEFFVSSEVCSTGRFSIIYECNSVCIFFSSKSNYISWVATFQKIDSMLTKDFIEFSQSEKSEGKFFNCRGKH